MVGLDWIGLAWIGFIGNVDCDFGRLSCADLGLGF